MATTHWEYYCYFLDRGASISYAYNDYKGRRPDENTRTGRHYMKDADRIQAPSVSILTGC
jgi:hypothetical protein